MPSTVSALDVNEMKEAIADWVEKSTGKRPSLDEISPTGWSDGVWCFETAPWRPTGSR
jgi:hypothetical protein